MGEEKRCWFVVRAGLSYYADVVHFVVSREACEGFSSGACFGNCRVFIMWSVQTIRPLSSLEDRRLCLVLESAYLLIRDSGVVT